MVSQSSLALELKLLHFIYTGSGLLQNVQQLFQFCLIYQYHKSIPKADEIKNLISRDKKHSEKKFISGDKKTFFQPCFFCMFFLRPQ